MTARTLAVVLALAAVVLAVAAALPAGAPRAGLGLAVMGGALLYLAAGLIAPRPARRSGHLTVIVGVRAGPVARCWTWPAPAPPAAL